MVKRRIKCPICGSLAWESSILRDYSLDVFESKGLGYGRGFSFKKIEGFSLIQILKNKIKFLYEKFFVVMKPIPLLSMPIFPSKSMKLVPSKSMNSLDFSKWEVIAHE